MNYNIKGTDFTITPEVREHVEQQLRHVEKFLQNEPTAHIDIELEFLAGEHGKKNRAEFTAAAAGETYRAEERGNTMHEAIDIAVGELSKSIRRNKKRHLRLVRKGAQQIKDIVRGFRGRF